MAVKKCDDIVEVEETTEEAAETTETTETPAPSQVSENVYLGKNITAVESTVYDASSVGLYPVFTFGDGNVTTTRPSDIVDPIRAETRKFFALDKDGRAVYVSSDTNALGETKETENYYPPSPIAFAFNEITGQNKNTGLTKTFSQQVTVSSRLFSSSEEWDVMVDGGELVLDDGSTFSRPAPLVDAEATFTDHFTKIVAPFSQQELDRFLNNVNNPAYAKAESKYNFFVAGYEDYISSGDIKEYSLENQFSNITRDGSALQQNLHSLGSDLSYVQSVLSEGFRSQYGGFDVTEKFKNIGIPQESVSSIKKVTNTDDLYTMINTVELNTSTTGKLGLAAEEAGMTDDLLKHVMDQTIVYPGNVAPASAENALDFLIATESIATAGSEVLIETDHEVSPVPLISVESWLQSYLNGTPEEVDSSFNTIAILLGINPAGAQESEECSAFANTLKSLILSGKIGNIVNENFRSYQEMIEGKEAYNETIIYQITKTPIGDGAGQQTIFIPNTQELDLLQYIDTQVKYDTEYRYDIYAHQLIVGTQYTYETTGARSFTAATNEYNTNFTVTYQPSLQIAQIPIFTQSARILDNAPVFPNVEIIPFKGVNNRLLINLDGNTGDYELQPIIISEDDSIFAEKFRKDRGLEPTDPITFKSDDTVSQFEIYRLDEPPQSYTDFNNQLLAIVSTPDATSTSFIDAIEPNTKYYYTFRSIDIHGNRSNPTDVFMVELVQFEGMIFFNQSVYEFGSETFDNVKVTRDFRRYIKINPNLIQSLINYDDLGEIKSAYEASTVNLGRAEESVWKKRFKMRITSKNSGKKFDINLSCKVNFTKDNSEPFTQQSGEQDPSKENKK